jgi:FkbM family methyltransferase
MDRGASAAERQFVMLKSWKGPRTPTAVRKKRELIYDALPGGYDFRCVTRNGTFVLNTADKYISRYTFLHREAFEYDKFEKAVRLVRDHCGIQAFDTLVDVGANIGSISIPAVESGTAKRAIAFEPEPGNFRRLVSSIELNGLSSMIDAVELAIGDIDRRRIRLELSDVNFGDHRVQLGRREGIFGETSRKAVRVQQRTIDSVLADENLGTFLMWIDTQGYEGHVLAGAEQVLRGRPPLAIEFWPYGLSRAEGYERLRAALRDAPHDYFMDLGQKKPRRQPLTLKNLDALFNGLGMDGDFTDILII